MVVVVVVVWQFSKKR